MLRQKRRKTQTQNAAHWVKTGTMQAAVKKAQAVQLGDGRVLAVGRTAKVTETEAELWDKKTNSWRKMESLEQGTERSKC